MAAEDETVCVDCEPPKGSLKPQSAPALAPTSTPAASDLLNASTFEAPDHLPTPRVVIEYCDRCRWQHRATWTQTELLLTFAPSESLPGGLRSVTILPRREEVEAGRWRIWLYKDAVEGPTLIWDRKIEGGFGEMKEVKKRIRDLVAPGASLGHSDGHKA